MPQGWDWVIIAIVFLLLFGAAKLPAMARSLGQSARIFKSEMKGMRDDDEARARSAQQPQQQALPASNQAGTANPAPNPQTADGAGTPDSPR